MEEAANAKQSVEDGSLLGTETRPFRRDKAQKTDGGSLTDRAYRRLEEMIVTLQLPPGTALSEASLAQQLEIGRTPIREALQRLSRDGLVTVFPRRGVLVSEISLHSQLRLLEVRRVLENLMARLAAERASEDECEAFAEIAAGMREAAVQSDDLEFMKLDRRLNQLLAHSARNEFATRSMSLMNALSRRFWYQHYKEAADLPLAANLHACLAEAVAERRARDAGEASDALVSYIESFARKTLDT